MLSKLVAMACGTLALVACAPMTVDKLRAEPAGKIEFDVGQGYKSAFQTVLARTKACYLNTRTTAQLIVSDSRNYDKKTGNVTVTLVFDATGEEAYLTIDVLGLSETSSKITAYYARSASQPEALKVQSWLVDGSSECAERAV